MKGTLEQLPSGSWRLVVMVAGVRHRRTIRARTKTEARAALAAMIAEVAATPADGWTTTVSELLRRAVAHLVLASSRVVRDDAACGRAGGARATAAR